MRKWLVVCGAVVVAALILLWKELDSSVAAPPVAPTPIAELRKPAPMPVIAEADRGSEPVAAPTPATPTAPDTPAKPDKIDPKSDEFFYAFDEMVVPNLSRDAVKCYENLGRRVHRNQDLTLGFKHKIENGRVTIHDVYVKKSTLNDSELESCFIDKIRNGGWINERLPDMPLDEDEIVLNPERGLKKYTRANIEYVGPEGPKWEGGI